MITCSTSDAKFQHHKRFSRLISHKKFMVVVLFALLALGAAQCNLASDCTSCLSRGEAGSPCGWCFDFTSSLNYGCVANVPCPGGVRLTSSCPVPEDFCSSSADCSMCTQRKGQDGSFCSWCSSSSQPSPTATGVCRQSNQLCPNSYSSAYYCPSATDYSALTHVLVGSLTALSLSVAIGLALGGYFYTKAIATTSLGETYRFAALTFGLSWVFVGCSLFSVLISFRARRLRLSAGRNWRCCPTGAIISLGIIEPLASLQEWLPVYPSMVFG